MKLSDLITVDNILLKSEYHSKKRVLEAAATRLGQRSDSLDENKLFSALIARERLGSTGLGNGIAIPHCHIEDIDRPMSLLITLAQPVDFDAIDNKPVDVLFVLIVPDGQEQKHLDTLAMIVEYFSNDTLMQQLRSADSKETLQQLIANH